MTINEATGDIYLASVNHLFRLSGKLEPLVILRTGLNPHNNRAICSNALPDITLLRRENLLAPSSEPANDSNLSECQRPHSSHADPSYSQALLYDSTRKFLIDCRTSYLGACAVRDSITLSASHVRIYNDQAHVYPSTVFPGKVPVTSSRNNLGPGRLWNRDGESNGVVALLAPPHYLVIGCFTYPQIDSKGSTTSGKTHYLANYALAPPHRLFHFAYRPLTGQSALPVNPKEGSDTFTNFVSGYSTPQQAYLIATRTTSVSSIKESLIAGIRITGPNLHYSEIGLECRKKIIKTESIYPVYETGTVTAAYRSVGDNRPEILIATFAHSENTNRTSDYQATDGPVICIYLLSEITRAHESTISATNQTASKQYVTSHALTLDCPDSSLKSHLLNWNTVENRLRVTSIVTSNVYGYTVVYLSTSDGRLFSLWLASTTSAYLYSVLRVSDNFLPILDPILMDRTSTTLYAVTPDKIYQISIDNCEAYTNCKSCLGAKNPYCGWCHLDKRCKNKTACQSAPHFNLDPASRQHLDSPNPSSEADWLPFDTGRCSEVTWIEPDQIQSTTRRNIRLVLNYFPRPLSLVYHCLFTSDGFNIRAKAKSLPLPTGVESGQTLGCRTPLLPANAEGRHFYIVTVAILGDDDVNPITETSIIAYNCGALTSCSGCVSSPRFACHWCVEKNACTHDAGGDCRNDFLVNGLAGKGATSRAGSSFCPRLEIMEDEQSIDAFEDYSDFAVEGSDHLVITKEPSADGRDYERSFKVHASRPFSLRMRAFSLQPFMTDLACHFIATRTGRTFYATAVFTNNPPGYEQITCSASAQVTSDTTSSLRLAVSWGGTAHARLLDGPYWPDPLSTVSYSNNESSLPKLANSIDVYNCSSLAGDCGACSLLPANLRCSWCIGALMEVCSLKDICEERSSTLTSLDRVNDTCPGPIIISFSPSSAPMEGGTELTINGLNLPRSLAHFTQGITVAGVACIPVLSSFLPTRRVTCVLERSGNETSGPVRFRVGRYPAVSKADFKFVNFAVTDIYPSRATKAGRTRVRLIGRHLDAGNTAHARLAGKACVVISRTEVEAVCLSLPFSQQIGDQIGSDKNGIKDGESSSGPVLFGVDGNFKEAHYFDAIKENPDSGNERSRFGNENGKPLMFEYVENPKLDSVTSPAGILSGGTTITVEGARFNNIQEALFMITLSNPYINLTESCVIRSDILMTCLAPRVLASDTSMVQPIPVPFSLVFDNALYYPENPTKLSGKSGLETGYGIYPDPRFDLLAVPNQLVKYSDEAVAALSSLPTENAFSITIMADISCYPEACKTPDFAIQLIPVSDRIPALSETKTGPVSASMLCRIVSMNSSSLTCQPPSPALVREFIYRSRRASESSLLSGNGGIENRVKTDHGPTDTFLIRVTVGARKNLISDVGYLKYNDLQAGPANFNRPISGWGLAAIVMAVLSLTGLTLSIFVFYRRKSDRNSRALKNMREQMNILELQVAQECKAAFAELQTDMTEITNEFSNVGGIPFLEYREYCMKVLFPNISDHPILHDTLKLEPSAHKSKVEKGLKLFEQLLCFKTFLLVFIKTLERDRYFSMKDRVNVASLIMVALQGKMDYCTDILKTLLSELIEKSMEGNSHPKLLLRRTESVAEKMLTAWFTFLLYRFLKECAGEHLFLLFRAIKQQAYKGPIDQITSEAKYSLSEEKLLRCHVEYQTLSIRAVVAVQEETSDFDHCKDMELMVKVLDVDTVTQVKEKILDQAYKNLPDSCKPDLNDLQLEWITGVHGRLMLKDEDQTSQVEGNWKRLNTLKHYRVPNESTLALQPSHPSIDTNISNGSSKSFLGSVSLTNGHRNVNSPSFPQKHRLINNHILQNNNHKGSPKYGNNYLINPNNQNNGKNNRSNNDSSDAYKLWHLVKPSLDMIDPDGKSGDRIKVKTGFSGKKSNSSAGDNGGNELRGKMVSEIYLTRLLATKGTLQKFVDDLFDAIFSTTQRTCPLPLAIKFMFDFLDDQAFQHGITDSEVVHTWKSNSLPLRFWVNLIKNPNFVLDVRKSHTVDACLSVIAQTFMDSCSTCDQRLGKDSPSSKLLYAKDISIYKEWVERYYQDIRMLPPVTDQEMGEFLKEESLLNISSSSPHYSFPPAPHVQNPDQPFPNCGFNSKAAIWQLYVKYACPYKNQLNAALDSDPMARQKHLAQRLTTVHSIIQQNNNNL
ncbi:unnamed protein product [Gordionus sp. m RMFG-2023]